MGRIYKPKQDIHYVDPVLGLSDKFAHKTFKAGDGNKYYGARYKQMPSSLGGGVRNTFYKRSINRSTQPSVDELEQRNKFRICIQAANTRAVNLSTLTSDMTNYGEDNKAGYQYPRFRGWLMALAYKKFWNSQTTSVDWPQDSANVRFRA